MVAFRKRQFVAADTGTRGPVIDTTGATLTYASIWRAEIQKWEFGTMS